MNSNKKIFVAPIIYILFILIPIYWLLIMSFKTNTEIGGSITLYPHQPTLDNYLFISSILVISNIVNSRILIKYILKIHSVFFIHLLSIRAWYIWGAFGYRAICTHAPDLRADPSRHVCLVSKQCSWQMTCPI